MTCKQLVPLLVLAGAVASADAQQLTLEHCLSFAFVDDARGQFYDWCETADGWRVSSDTGNPIYEGTSIEGTNTLYESTAAFDGPDGFGPAIQFVRTNIFKEEFGQVQAEKHELSTLITLVTNGGDYATSPDMPGVFETLDDPAGTGIEKIRWTSEEAIVTYRVMANGELDANDAIVIAPQARFTSIPVPEPTAALLLAFAAIATACRVR